MSKRTKIIRKTVKGGTHSLDDIKQVIITAASAENHLPWSISFAEDGELLKIWIRKDRFHASLPFEGEDTILGLRDGLVLLSELLEIDQDEDKGRIRRWLEAFLR